MDARQLQLNSALLSASALVSELARPHLLEALQRQRREA
jgi:hypothetical protein